MDGNPPAAKKRRVGGKMSRTGSGWRQDGTEAFVSRCSALEFKQNSNLWAQGQLLKRCSGCRHCCPRERQPYFLLVSFNLPIAKMEKVYEESDVLSQGQHVNNAQDGAVASCYYCGCYHCLKYNSFQAGCDGTCL